MELASYSTFWYGIEILSTHCHFLICTLQEQTHDKVHQASFHVCPVKAQNDGVLAIFILGKNSCAVHAIDHLDHCCGSEILCGTLNIQRAVCED